jgi:hypothetical protein
MPFLPGWILLRTNVTGATGWSGKLPDSKTTLRVRLSQLLCIWVNQPVWKSNLCISWVFLLSRHGIVKNSGNIILCLWAIQNKAICLRAFVSWLFNSHLFILSIVLRCSFPDLMFRWQCIRLHIGNVRSQINLLSFPLLLNLALWNEHVHLVLVLTCPYCRICLRLWSCWNITLDFTACSPLVALTTIIKECLWSIWNVDWLLSILIWKVVT